MSDEGKKDENKEGAGGAGKPKMTTGIILGLAGLTVIAILVVILLFADRDSKSGSDETSRRRAELSLGSSRQTSSESGQGDGSSDRILTVVKELEDEFLQINAEFQAALRRADQKPRSLDWTAYWASVHARMQAAFAAAQRIRALEAGRDPAVSSAAPPSGQEADGTPSIPEGDGNVSSVTEIG